MTYKYVVSFILRDLQIQLGYASLYSLPLYQIPLVPPRDMLNSNYDISMCRPIRLRTFRARVCVFVGVSSSISDIDYIIISGEAARKIAIVREKARVMESVS